MCGEIHGTGTYVTYMRAIVHVPSLFGWCGTVSFSITAGMTYEAQKIVHGCAPTYYNNFDYTWTLNRSFANQSQACIWVWTDTNSVYWPGTGIGCFTIHT
jgi:hypothetical protein